MFGERGELIEASVDLFDLQTSHQYQTPKREKRANPRQRVELSPEGELAPRALPRAASRARSTDAPQQRRERLSEPESQQPVAVHPRGIPARAVEEEDEEAAKEIGPAVVEHGAGAQDEQVPVGGVVDVFPDEAAARVVLGEVVDQDIDFDGEQADG